MLKKGSGSLLNWYIVVLDYENQYEQSQSSKKQVDGMYVCMYNSLFFCELSHLLLPLCVWVRYFCVFGGEIFLGGCGCWPSPSSVSQSKFFHGTIHMLLLSLTLDAYH